MPDASALAAPVLSSEQADWLARLTEGLDGASLWWLSGYSAGLAQARAPLARALVAVADAAPQPRLRIIYGSQTGNAQRIAESLAQRMQASGLAVQLLRADAYPLRELKDERFLCIVISTQGDGDPPDDARALVEFIAGKRAPRLPELRYAVLGLGDSSYPQFCAIGQMLDARLAELGAQRWLARADADLDLATIAEPWLEGVLSLAREALQPSPLASAPPLSSAPLLASAPSLASVVPLRPAQPATATREHPFAADVLVNQRITGRDSDRDIRHLELSLQGSNLRYQPGDALGVWPRNPPNLVEAVLGVLALDGEQPVAHADENLPLRQWLSQKRELTRLSRPWLVAHAQRADSDALRSILLDPPALAPLFAREQLIDLLQAYPAQWSAQDLVATLRPLQPRLYSIASSQAVVGDEAHLAVAHVQYRREDNPLDDGWRWGAASHLLADSGDGASLPVFIEANERFRLPRDGARDIVMIGAGTGVAPYRGFVQERIAAGANGRNWLLFGNRNARSDFLYQLEWQDALQRGQLHRLDLAFSRDQPQKVYVQDRLREHGRALYAALQEGAHLYVCGAVAMGKSVHAALLAVLATHGGHDGDAAGEYLDALHAQGRYARDVY